MAYTKDMIARQFRELQAEHITVMEDITARFRRLLTITQTLGFDGTEGYASEALGEAEMWTLAAMRAFYESRGNGDMWWWDVDCTDDMTADDYQSVLDAKRTEESE